MPKIDDPEDLKKLQDYGAELASLRADLDKAKQEGGKTAALETEIKTLKESIAALVKGRPDLEAEASEYAGFWAGLL